MTDPLEPRRLPPFLVIALSLAISLAPVTLQTVTLALSQSLVTTLLVAAILACLFILGGMRYQALVYGSLDAVPGGSIVSLVIAVLVYHLLALPMAFILYAKFIAPAAAHH
jgi:hypothetical protein